MVKNKRITRQFPKEFQWLNFDDHPFVSKVIRYSNFTSRKESLLEKEEKKTQVDNDNCRNYTYTHKKA